MIQQTEVDGVPTLVAASPGPLVAGLTFRVGRADETLARAGITHLVEHLALYRQNLTDYHVNGATGSVVTHFFMQGSEADIVSFVNGVCASLTDLPLERLETEKTILRTEEAGRRGGANAVLPLWRYGAAGYGMVSYPEWGVHQLTADDVRQWAGTWFTRGNAVLWIAGDRVPPGLTLRLPDGDGRRSVPAATSALPVTPAYFTEGRNGVVFDGILRRRTVGNLLAGVLERELFRSLRQEGGYSYTASAAYEPRGDGYATLTAYADALAEKQDAVVGGFIDVLAAFKAGRIEQSDLDASRAHAEEALRQPDVEAARLPAMAMNLLTGEPLHTVEEVREAVRAATLEDVHAAAIEVIDTGLLQVPAGHTADWAGYAAAPIQSNDAVDGRPHRSLEHDDINLVVGPEGVSVVEPGGRVTVRYADCAAALAWPDGGRHLIGRDALTVRVEPTLYQLDPAAIQAIDAAVPPSAVVRMPPRDPDAIPRPAPRTDSGGAARKPGRVSLVVMILLFALGSFGCCFAGLLSWATTQPLAPGEPEYRDTEWYVGLTIFWAITLAFLIPATVMLWRRLKTR